MNFNAKQDVFVNTFINEKGLKEIMILIEKGLGIQEPTVIAYATQMLVNLFSF